MAYDNQCGTCYRFYDKNDRRPYDTRDTEDGYCERYGQPYDPKDSCFYYVDRRTYVHSACYITTMVCGRLGMDDKCDVLETLRSFRGEVLQKDEKYKDILYEYDTVGPEIAKNLMTEDIDVIESLYKTYLTKIVGLIKLHQYDNAINRYVSMTKSLEECYGISYDGKVSTNYDYSKGGHGKLMIR